MSAVSAVAAPAHAAEGPPGPHYRLAPAKCDLGSDLGRLLKRGIPLMPGHQSEEADTSGEAALVPSVHDEISRRRQEHPPKKGILFNAVVTVVEIGGAIALFHIAQQMGASDVVSYLVGSIGPVLGGLVVWAKARKFSGGSAAIFAFTAVSAIIAVAGSTTPKILLYKDCAATGLIGLIFLGSCVLARRPIVFFMAQRYGSDGTHDGMEGFDMMWDAYQDFRTGMYVTTYLWAALFLVQATGTAEIISRGNYSTAYTFDQILPLVAVVLGIVGSIGIGRYFTNRGRARGAAATTS